MKVWAAHTIFAAILVGSLAAKERGPEASLDDSLLLEPAVMRVARSHGLEFREYKTIDNTYLHALEFEAPGCPGPVLISLRLGSFEEESLQSPAEAGYVRYYVYYDNKWDKPERWAVLLQRAKYEALAMFGLTEYVVSWRLLMIDAPERCEAAEAVDWRPVWNRNYLFAADPRPI
jgi:hypothetical protein